MRKYIYIRNTLFISYTRNTFTGLKLQQACAKAAFRRAISTPKNMSICKFSYAYYQQKSFISSYLVPLLLL